MSSALYVYARACRLLIQSLFNDTVNMTLCTALNCSIIWSLWFRKDVGGNCPGTVPAASAYSRGVQPLLKQGHKPLSWAGSRAARINKHSMWCTSFCIVTWNRTLADLCIHLSYTTTCLCRLWPSVGSFWNNRPPLKMGNIGSPEMPVITNICCMKISITRR